MSDVALPAGHAVKLRLADGEVLELLTVEPTAPTPGAASSSLYTLWWAVFPLTKETAAALSTQGVTDIRTTLPNGDITWKVRGKTLEKAFACAASFIQ